MATTRTQARKTTAKKTTPARKPAAKKTATAAKPATQNRETVVDLRKPLAVRRRNFVGPHTPDQLTEARAAQASAMAALPIPVLAWTVPTQTTTRRAAAHLADGTVITHVAHRNPVFTADIPCRHGARHNYTITTATELTEARQDAATCALQHATDDQHQAITDGIHTPVVHTLAAALTARVDAEAPKEHPQP